MGADDVEIRRSRRRRRTVSAYLDGGRLVVLLPAGMSAAEEKHWVKTMRARVLRKRRRSPASDEQLMRRASDLSEAHLGGMAKPISVRWVTNQHSRWGSCTPLDRTIRLSHRLQSMPDYVIDYVLLHELAHLVVPGHGADFWALLSSYERTERARGYLEGVSGRPEALGD